MSTPSSKGTSGGVCSENGNLLLARSAEQALLGFRGMGSFESISSKVGIKHFVGTNCGVKFSELSNAHNFRLLLWTDTGDTLASLPVDNSSPSGDFIYNIRFAMVDQVVVGGNHYGWKTLLSKNLIVPQE